MEKLSKSFSTRLLTVKILKKIQSFRHIDSMGAFASPLRDRTFSLVRGDIVIWDWTLGGL